MIKNKIELLSPAGDFYKGKAALDFGADAIYFGAKLFSLRARASNFDYKDIKNMCIYAHKLGKKAYLVTNIICHNHDIKSFTTFLHRVMKYKIDGFICSDPFIINTIKQNYPKAEIHISTQQSVTNSKAALFFQRNGASRIVMARETSFNELKQTVKNVNNKIDIECFVHGAMCIAYSGRCMLSNYFCLRDSNAGGCAQSCRWNYKIFNNFSPIVDFSISAKDLSLIENIKKMLNIGLRSIKIEGRMKTEHYIVTVINAYRKIIDNISNSKIAKEYIVDIKEAANRDTDEGWYNGNPAKNAIIQNNHQHIVSQRYVMQVIKKISNVKYEVISKNFFDKRSEFKVIGKKLNKIEYFKIVSIIDINNKCEVEVVNKPMTKLMIKINRQINMSPGDILRIC